MKRYNVTLGAKTNVGGVVVSASGCCTIDGARAAVEGDRIACPACKSEGVIRPDGERLIETWDGKQAALEGDLCVCRCAPPPRLLANQTAKYQCT